MTGSSERGQMVLPMFALLFLFGLTCVLYLGWCRERYWQMRMDVAADCTALSAAREEARLLNYMASQQVLENVLLQKAGADGKDIGYIQVAVVKLFDLYNGAMQLENKAFFAPVIETAEKVARANGATAAVPLRWPSSLLKPHGVSVAYFHLLVPVGGHYYPEAYLTRTWHPNDLNPQPTHVSWWLVRRNGINSWAKARLRLDVNSNSTWGNGGFPPEKPSLWRELGIQCFFPQFFAELYTNKDL